MKNILKKLGVFGLIVAVFSPFIVNAETNTTCEKNLHNYLFLDVAYPREFKEVYVEGPNGASRLYPGYVTYANFSYRFPETTNTEIKNISVTLDYVESEAKERQYWNLYTTVHSNALSNKTNSLGSYYLNYNNHEVGGSVFVNSQSTEFDKNTILLHTKWARRDEWGNAIPSEWQPQYNELTVQEILGGNIVTGTSVIVDGATYINNQFGSLTNSYASKMPDYFKDVIENNSPSNTKVLVDNEYYIPLQITRKLSANDFDGKVFGFVDNDKVYVFTTENIDKGASFTKNDITDSYEAYNLYEDEVSELNKSDSDYGTKLNAIKARYQIELPNGTESDIDFNKDERYYWPVVLNVKFDECTNVAEVPEDPEDTTGPTVKTWGVSYNGNVKDATEVTNVPKGQSEKVGANIVISKEVPKRNGYTFDGWCETEGACAKPYKAGDTFEYKSEIGEKTIPLFAQWKQTGTEDNKKTGVVSYIIGFSAVAVVAGGIYLISKKNNLFKQI